MAEGASTKPGHKKCQGEVLWWCCYVHSWIFSPGFCTLLSESCLRFYVCVIQTQSWSYLWFSWQQIPTHRNLSWLLYIILYWRSSKNNKADRFLQKPVSLISFSLFTKLVYIYVYILYYIYIYVYILYYIYIYIHTHTHTINLLL